MVEEIEEIMDESEYTLISDHMTIQEISAEILRLWETDVTMVHDYFDGCFKPTVFLSIADYKNTDKESQFIVGLFKIGVSISINPSSFKKFLTAFVTLCLSKKFFCIFDFLKSRYLYFNLRFSDTSSSSFIYIGGV